VNHDSFTAYSIAHANQPPFAKTFGVLSPEGLAAPAIHLPAGTSPALAGLAFDHACVVIHPGTLAVRSASNAASLSLSP